MCLDEKADIVVGGSYGPGLSGGQKRKLAIAIQLLKEPQVGSVGLSCTGSYRTQYTKVTLYCFVFTSSPFTSSLALHILSYPSHPPSPFTSFLTLHILPHPSHPPSPFTSSLALHILSHPSHPFSPFTSSLALHILSHPSHPPSLHHIRFHSFTPLPFHILHSFTPSPLHILLHSFTPSPLHILLHSFTPSLLHILPTLHWFNKTPPSHPPGAGP